MRRKIGVAIIALQSCDFFNACSPDELTASCPMRARSARPRILPDEVYASKNAEFRLSAI